MDEKEKEILLRYSKEDITELFCDFYDRKFYAWKHRYNTKWAKKVFDEIREQIKDKKMK